MQRTFADEYGDELTVSTGSRSRVYLNAEVTDDEGEEVDLAFNKSEATKVADAIYEAAGSALPVPVGAVRAGDVPLNEALLRVAAAHNVPATFRYVKGPSMPVENRTLIPAGIKKFPDHVTFTGYDEDRGAVRAFRSDRIRGTVSVGA